MVKKLFIIISILAVSIPAIALEKAATVNTSKGRVEIVHGDAVMGKRAKKGAELVIKDILRTKRRGYAEVGFIDGTNVKVFEKSRLTINGIDRTVDGYNAEIQKGKVLFNVEKMANVAGDFRVKTTNSVIGVKGTTFGVVSGGMVTIVEVYNGNVEVLATADAGDLESGQLDVGSLEGSGKGGDSGENRETLATNLSSGQGLILSSSGDVQVYEFSSDGGSKSLIFQGDVSADKKSDDKATGSGEGKADSADTGADDGGADDNAGTAEDTAGTDDSEGGDTAGLGNGGDTPPGPPEEGDDKGGAIDDILFGAIGLIEKDAAGEGKLDDGGLGADEPGRDLPGGNKLGALDDVMDGIDIGDVVKDALVPDNVDKPGAGNDVDIPDVSDIADDIKDVVDEANDFYSDPDVRPDTEEQIEEVLGTVNINITFK